MFGEYIAKVLYWFCYTLIARRTRPMQIIGKKDKPYLLRWSLFGITKKTGKPRRPFGFTVYLHCFVRSDDDTHHDHPWNWWSFIIKGGCREHTKGDIEQAYSQFGVALITDNRMHYTDPFDIATDHYAGEFRGGKAADPHWIELWPASDAIRLDLPKLTQKEHQDILLLPACTPCWTIFIMGPWQRDWGFHTKTGWMFWRDYLRARGEANGAF